MASNSNTNSVFRERYWTGAIADAPSDGEVWIDSGNTNRIMVFRGTAWSTPQFDAITLTGTTTVTTLNSTTLTNTGTLTAGALTSASTFRANNQRIVLGEALVPTAATSLVGLVQIGAVPGAPLNTGVPTTNSVYITYDTVRRGFAVNIAGSWFTEASMSLY